MIVWGSGGEIWRDEQAVLGEVHADNSANIGPVSLLRTDQETGIVFTTAARLDYRAELIASLSLSGTAHPAELTDGDLIWQAYRRWGANCVHRIYGNWAFAAWEPSERKLLLGRDPYGSTALYYYLDPHVFAFASSPRALLALKLAPHQIDELYLAQALVFQFTEPRERTIYRSIRRLPPAHTICVTPARSEIHHYWQPEKTPLLQLPARRDYVEAFREVFEKSVRNGLRGGGERDDLGATHVGVTLSGGLDSGSVAGVAAQLLGENGHRLAAYTSVPLCDAERFVEPRFGNEFPYAQAVAQQYANIDLYAVTASHLTPVQAVRQCLRISPEPTAGAGNAYWLLGIMQAAQAHGRRVLLTGQEGNIGISWTGSVFSQPLTYQIQQLGWRTWGKTVARRSLPGGIFEAFFRRKLDAQRWYRASAIQPDFARSSQLLEHLKSAPRMQPAQTPLEQRRRMIAGRGPSGALYAELGAAYGLEILDPTADVKVLEFTFAVPDRIFMEPAVGLDRWLIRAAMQDVLPDEVRLNRRRGRQSADLIPRLRASATEVDATLDALASGPAAAYVDVGKMRQTWQTVQTEDSVEAFSRSVTVLMRGIMVGLCVHEFDHL